MSVVDILIRLAYWLLVIDEADKRDGMPQGYRRRYALILYRLIVAGILIYFALRASGCLTASTQASTDL